MTWVMPRATSVSAGVPAEKSGIAIGTGWTLPCVMSSLSCAAAGPASMTVSAPAEVAAPSASTRRRVSSG